MRSSTDWLKIRRRERGKVAWSKLWLNPEPKINLCKPPGKSHSVQALVEVLTKVQAFQTACQGHLVQALVQCSAKCQALQTAWKSHSVQVLVKAMPKGQALQTAWKSHEVQALVEVMPNGQMCLGSGEMVLYKLSTEMLPISVTPSSAISSSEQDNVAAYNVLFLQCLVEEQWRSKVLEHKS